MILKPFSAMLHDTIQPDTMYPPLTKADESRLLVLLADEESIYLTLDDGVYKEWVLVRNECGYLIMERGVDGSEPRKFVKGSCLFFETSVPVIKWLICNYDCCDDLECPCVSVKNAGMVLPPVQAGVSWKGSAVFTGDTPMAIGVTGMPSWMHANIGANFVEFSGTPSGSGTYHIVATASNCSGKYIAVQQGATGGDGSGRNFENGSVAAMPMGFTTPTDADYARLLHPVGIISDGVVTGISQPDVDFVSSEKEKV